jgi:hypothetical protein
MRGPCRNCCHFSPGAGRVKHPEDFCCISTTVNALREDYPGVFKPEAKFPPSPAAFIDWPEKDSGCDLFKPRPDPKDYYSA